MGLLELRNYGESWIGEQILKDVALLFEQCDGGSLGAISLGSLAPFYFVWVAAVALPKEKAKITSERAPAAKMVSPGTLAHRRVCISGISRSSELRPPSQQSSADVLLVFDDIAERIFFKRRQKGFRGFL